MYIECEGWHENVQYTQSYTARIWMYHLCMWARSMSCIYSLNHEGIFLVNELLSWLCTYFGFLSCERDDEPKLRASWLAHLYNYATIMIQLNVHAGIRHSFNCACKRAIIVYPLFCVYNIANYAICTAFKSAKLNNWVKRWRKLIIILF